MHNPDSVLKNETHKLLGDLNIEMDYLILAGQQKKKKKKTTYRIVDFTVQADHRVKLKESEKKGL